MEVLKHYAEKALLWFGIIGGGIIGCCALVFLFVLGLFLDWRAWIGVIAAVLVGAWLGWWPLVNPFGG